MGQDEALKMSKLLVMARECLRRLPDGKMEEKLQEKKVGEIVWCYARETGGVECDLSSKIIEYQGKKALGSGGGSCMRAGNGGAGGAIYDG